MTTAYPNLTREMKEHNISCVALADYLDLTYMATYRRLRGVTEWQLHEAIAICTLLECSDIEYLFLRLDTN